MVTGPCRLCSKHAKLQESHIVPAFVFRQMKESSATGFLRFGQKPNQRVQDGEKRYWLCDDCEGRFNQWETKFSNQVFYPLIKDGGQQIQYEDWMLKFCVSVSWRVLSMFIEDGLLGHLSNTQQSAAELALKRWGAFMLGDEQHPGKYEQHFIPLDSFGSSNGGEVPVNINRYLLRAVDLDVVPASDMAFVYSKLKKFILVGFIDVRHPKHWGNTKVHVRGGYVGQGDVTLPMDFRDYLFGRARRYGELLAGISETQRAKIATSMRGNMDRVIASETFKALDNDVELFGDEAFRQDRPADDP